MTMHVIARPNNRWPPGTWFECTDWGCRIVELESKDNRMFIRREKGVIFPFSEIRDYVATCMNKGLNSYDKKWTTKGKKQDTVGNKYDG